jgi:HAD superfamily hydrolase (TIGR01509 family)
VNTKALFIDMDGTLVDSMPAMFDVYKEFLADYGFTGNKEEFATLVGPSVSEIVNILKERYQISGDTDYFVSRYNSIIAEKYKEALLFPGTIDFLQFAKKQGLLLALVTAAPKHLAEFVLAKHRIHHFFDCVLTGNDVEQAKPHPEIYLLALEKLNTKISRSFAIEDSVNGIISATEAGLRTLLISHGSDFKYDKAESVVVSWSAAETYLKRE